MTQDVALLQIEGVSNLPYVTLGDSSAVAVGEQVVAIGNALGLGGKPSVVSGSISATNRTITASDSTGTIPETLHGLLETSAQIAPGDSGGPLVNTKGQVIGMDTAAASADGSGATIGFAIPINTAKTIVQQIERVRPRVRSRSAIRPSSASTRCQAARVRRDRPGFGSLPGSGSNTTPSTSTAGVTITGVIQASPAAKAGLQGGDVITSVNGHTTDTWSALQSAIAAEKPGDQVTVHYVDQSGTAHTATGPARGAPQVARGSPVPTPVARLPPFAWDRGGACGRRSGTCPRHVPLLARVRATVAGATRRSAAPALSHPLAMLGAAMAASRRREVRDGRRAGSPAEEVGGRGRGPRPEDRRVRGCARAQACRCRRQLVFELWHPRP